MTVRFILNGTPIRVDEVDPHTTLLAWLRSSGRTGSKEGCAEGECGACAVALLQTGADGQAQLVPVNSCLMPLPSVDGKHVISVEGVAAVSGELHPVQAALVEQGGSQCGYCTPGFVVSLFCEYYRRDRAGYDPEAIAGNLCRCTGYRPIIAAAQSLTAPAPDDPNLALLLTPPTALRALQHQSGERRFLRPTALPELFECWARYPDAVLIAGGTDLMVYVNQQHQRFATWIALDALPELKYFAALEREWALGAGLPLSHLAARLEQAGSDAHALQQLWPLFSSKLIRNRATLGGNLATASPIGDAAPVLLALDAELTLSSARGTRRLPLREFFLTYRKTALASQELIVSVHLPRPLPTFQRFYKASKRTLDDISTVAGAFALDLTEDQRVRRLRVAFGGVAATPVRAERVEQLARDKPWTAATLAQLLPELAQVGSPLSDHRGSSAYRRALLGKLFERFFADTQSAAQAAE